MNNKIFINYTYNLDFLIEDEIQIEADYVKEYDNLNTIQKIFITFEYSSICYLSFLVQIIIQGAIIVGVVSFILQSEDSYQYKPTTCSKPVCNNDSILCPNSIVCEPIPFTYFSTIDTVIIAIFTFDYLIRSSTCIFVPARLANIIPSSWDANEQMEAILQKRSSNKDPKPYPIWYHFYKYAFSWNNLIDIVSIIPFYITLGQGNGNVGTSTSFLRVARLFRLVKIIRLGDPMILALLSGTLKKSIEALTYNVFCFILAIIMFGSIIFLIEQGNFQVVEGIADGWEKGYYIRDNIYGQKAITPYTSISSGMYWAAITLTTLGYGDLYPTTDAGRFIASICAMFGILVLALPVSVIGGIFTELYSATKKHRKKKKMLQIKKEEIISSSESNSNSNNTIELTQIQSKENTKEDKLESDNFDIHNILKSMKASEVLNKLEKLSSNGGLGLNDGLHLIEMLTDDYSKLRGKYAELQNISRVLSKEMKIMKTCYPEICKLMEKIKESMELLSSDPNVKDIALKARKSVLI